MPLELITGNRMERLFDELARELSRPCGPVLAPEIVAVQGPAMQRWLSLHLARRLGICANTRFEYPNAIISDLVRCAVPAQSGSSPYEPDVLTWKILAHLPASLDLPEFAPVAAYMRDATPRMTFQLAARIAAAFDQYLIYRTDMIKAWQDGRQMRPGHPEEAWQAALWRRIVSETPEDHRPGLARLFFEALGACPELARMLPARISVFGISYLPPFHIEFFDRLSDWLPVRMYVLNPCREYWGEIVPEARAARLSAEAEPDALYFEQGHALLAAWGAHGREFFNRAVEMDLPIRECFDEDLPMSMLGRLQADIMQLIDRRRVGHARHAVNSGDRSIQIHACHSATRELEVLRDCLLDMFSAHPDLRCDDVLVMTPCMQEYAPGIQAVFGTPAGVELPFSIADRSLGSTAGMVSALQALLRLPGSRMQVSDVLPVLECPAVQRRFGLTLEDVESLQEWIAETRICWGLDRDDRRAAGVPETYENTWRFGLDRMLLGYAMDEADGMFEGVLACDGMQGENARPAGVLADMLDHLAAFRQAAAQERSLDGWSEFLQGLLQRFFEPGEEDRYAWDHLQRCAARPALLQAQAGFNGPVAYEMLLELLEHELAHARHPAGFFSGAVTFAEMQPMRAIPFRVLCLIGMNDRAFPRQAFLPGFHLMAPARRPGDRAPGKDDRYMFLEALLSARDALIITYTGRSQQDNASLPPSVLVSELLDTLEQCCGVEGRDTREHVVYRHFLQAFNTGYFMPGGRLQSFAEHYCACARALTGGVGPPQDFFDLRLPAPGPVALEVDDLVRFFKNPLAALLRTRLNAGLDPQVFSITERESFRLGTLERYWLEQELLRDLLEGRATESSYARCAARGILPHGPAGRIAWQNALRAVTSFVDDVHRAGLTCAQGESRQVELIFDECTLSAAVRLQTDGRLVRMRHAAIKPNDFLRIWLDYLILCCAPDTQAPSALLAGLDPGNRSRTRLWRFSPVDDPGSVLAGLLELYSEGMCAPLVFLPRASFTYAEALHSGKSTQESRAAAATSLERGDFKNSELDDACFGRFFDESVVDSPDFDRCARAVFAPLLDHCLKIE